MMTTTRKSYLMTHESLYVSKSCGVSV